MILARRAGETIVIDNRILLTVLDFGCTAGGHPRVRLGFNADPSIPIDRGEVHVAIERDGQRRTKERSEDVPVRDAQVDGAL